MKENRKSEKDQMRLAASKLLKLKAEGSELEDEIPLQLTSSKKTLKITNFNSLNKEFGTKKSREDEKVGKWSFNFEEKSLEWSPEVYDIFEYPEGYTGSLVEFYMSSIDKKTVERLPEMMDVFDGKRGDSVMSQTVITPSGRKKILSFSSFPLLDNEGKLIGIKGGVIDVTDEIEGKNGLNNFFSMSNDLHCITHLDTYFLKVSPAWSKLLGYSEEELLSRSYLNFIHPDDVDGSYSAVVEVDKDSTSLSFENRYLKKKR